MSKRPGHPFLNFLYPPLTIAIPATEETSAAFTSFRKSKQAYSLIKGVNEVAASTKHWCASPREGPGEFERT